ncbi:MAG: hypothetical protein ACKVXR_01480 [Planctomycetota bacterium]
MNPLRRALFTSTTAAAVLLLAAGFLPARPQEAPAHTPVSRSGQYSFTDAEGNYQRALDGAVAMANDALSHQGGQVINDLMFSWQAIAVTGVHGGLMHKRDVTVTIQVLK